MFDNWLYYRVYYPGFRYHDLAIFHSNQWMTLEFFRFNPFPAVVTQRYYPHFFSHPAPPLSEASASFSLLLMAWADALKDTDT